MMRLFLLAAAGVLAFASAASAEAERVRVRGVVESSTADALTVKTSDGRSETVALASGTPVVSVVKSSLDQVGEGKFIGTATKGDNPPTALEVVVFPDDMRGTGEGHYPWDEITDTTAAAGGKAKSAMTNGTVKAARSGGPKVKSSMTNGTVKSGRDAGGAKTIDVTYGDGRSLTIRVPPSAPIVALERADRSAIAPGAKVFVNAVKDGDKLAARSVAVGKDGVTPPM